jgi:hypothetical protein
MLVVIYLVATGTAVDIKTFLVIDFCVCKISLVLVLMHWCWQFN